METISMKIRTSFISNSSSTSFVVFGCYFKKDFLLKYLEKRNLLDKEEIEPDPYSYDIDELLQEKLTPLGFYYIADGERNSGFVGLNIEGRKADQNFVTDILDMDTKLEQEFGAPGVIMGGEIFTN